MHSYSGLEDVERHDHRLHHYQEVLTPPHASLIAVLQHAAGNGAVSRLLDSRSRPQVAVQRDLPELGLPPGEPGGPPMDPGQLKLPNIPEPFPSGPTGSAAGGTGGSAATGTTAGASEGAATATTTTAAEAEAAGAAASEGAAAATTTAAETAGAAGVSEGAAAATAGEVGLEAAALGVGALGLALAGATAGVFGGPLIGYLIQHAGETAEQTDPDEVSLPGGTPVGPSPEGGVGEKLPGVPTVPAVDPGSIDSATLPGTPAAEPAQAPGAIVDSAAECKKRNLAKERHDHHIFPQTFEAEFRRIGIIPDNYTITIPGDQHIGKTGVHQTFDWNGEWQDFLDEIPTGPLSKADINSWNQKAFDLAVILIDRAGMSDLEPHPFRLRRP